MDEDIARLSKVANNFVESHIAAPVVVVLHSKLPTSFDSYLLFGGCVVAEGMTSIFESVVEGSD